MFSWLVILRLVLSLADKIFDQVKRSNQLDEGALRELNKQIGVLDEKVERAKQIRTSVRNASDAGELYTSDGFRRD